MKSLTLPILSLLWEYIWTWEVYEYDTWLHKRPWVTEECQRRAHACDACGLVPGKSISDCFLLTLPFCFCLDVEMPTRSPLLIPPCTHPPRRISVWLLSDGKKKGSKSEIFTINFQSRVICFFSSPFSWLSHFLCTLGLQFKWPSFTSSNSDVGHFTFVTIRSMGLSLM